MKHLVVLAILAAVSGCQTFESYGRAWGENDRSLAGVETRADAEQRYADTAAERAALFGAREAKQLERCEMLRHQLVTASRDASFTVGMVWGCPLAWPIDLVMLLFWPIGETQKAQAVWAQAERMERAYQADTKMFLEVCQQVKATPVGRAFMSVQLPKAPPPEPAAASNVVEETIVPAAEPAATDAATDAETAPATP
jgi:hypothetical protein